MDFSKRAGRKEPAPLITVTLDRILVILVLLPILVEYSGPK
jgi:hypothetical protein